HYEPGDFIFKAGEKVDALFVINQGEVRLVGGANTAAEAAVDGALSQAWREVFGHKSAEKADVAPANDPSKLPADPKGRRFDPGETFGESALLTGRARSCSAVAETSVDALRLDRKALQQMVESSPRLALAVSRILAQRLGLAGQHEAELEAEVAHWRETPGHDPGVVTAAEEQALHEAHKANAAAPVAIFLGALLDGIPESLVIGAELVAGAAFNPTFVAAVFISNLPEAMSSAAGMKQAGFTTRRVMGLWTGLTVASAVASFLGNLLLAESNPALVAVVDAVAGGGILAMLASTMMPEAFEQGGPSVSLSTIAGFLAAFFFHALGT
ncbi:MAG: Crp/Fnr family transcriptional regulator, partial [Candidatus Binatota bacterium]